MKSEIVFLEIAKKDLEAARRLSEAKLFPEAVFYLEQSVEKAIKSFGIWRKVIDEEEARRMRHHPIKIYFKMAQKSKEMVLSAKSKIRMLPRKYGVIDESELDAIIQRLDEFERQYPDNGSLLNISCSKAKIDDALQLIRAMKSVMVDQLAEKGAELASSTIDPDKLEELRRPIFERLRDSHESDPKTLEEGKRSVNEVMTPGYFSAYGKVLEIAELHQFCFFSLLILCGIFAPHASRSRYPFHGIDPLELYTKGLPLVDALADFIEVTMYSLYSLDRLYTRALSLSQAQ